MSLQSSFCGSEPIRCPTRRGAQHERQTDAAVSRVPSLPLLLVRYSDFIGLNEKSICIAMANAVKRFRNENE